MKYAVRFSSTTYPNGDHYSNVNLGFSKADKPKPLMSLEEALDIAKMLLEYEAIKVIIERSD